MAGVTNASRKNRSRKNESKKKAKTEKRAGVQAEAKRVATGIVRSVANTQAKAIAKAGTQEDPVAEVKAVSKNKIVTEMKEGALADFSPKAEDEATRASRFCSVAEASAESRSTCKDKTGIDTWFWAEEEASVGSWFWNGEEAGNRFSAKDEGKADICPPSCAKKLEPVAGANCKARPGAEEEEEENVIGSWFWDGDETSFDPNPRPVSRIIKPQPVDEINEKGPRTGLR
ncbi:protein BHLHb9 isoform X1 [Pontoporia blainvillei]|uniref:Protein BHLHb9 isoform X1 n=1 Tax=Pontoporia blainvillei TaxID=48723 RepID=A0ABX0S2T5_PONBL|nr:protein BHLHb9 isoform X1 [Pontoporia blainvillei]